LRDAEALALRIKSVLRINGTPEQKRVTKRSYPHSTRRDNRAPSPQREQGREPGRRSRQPEELDVNRAVSLVLIGHAHHVGFTGQRLPEKIENPAGRRNTLQTSCLAYGTHPCIEVRIVKRARRAGQREAQGGGLHTQDFRAAEMRSDKDDRLLAEDVLMKLSNRLVQDKSELFGPETGQQQEFRRQGAEVTEDLADQPSPLPVRQLAFKYHVEVADGSCARTA